MVTKQIGITEEVFNDLIEYKNKKASIGKKSKYSFTDAIKDLLNDSKTLSEWVKGKKKS